MKRQFARQGFNKRRPTLFLILTTGIVCAWFSNAAATEVYTWTDADGVTHFSDVPVDPAQTRIISVDGSAPAGQGGQDASASDQTPATSDPGDVPLSMADKRREQLAKERADFQARQADLKRECAMYQSRLTQIEPARRVLYTNDQGETVRMNDDERMTIINESKDFIAKNCK